MISDEVLDSIQILRFFHDKCNSEKSIGMMQVYRVDELAKAIESILNFIEKQQKEIEELKETLKCTQNSWYEDTKIIDKIKAKIEPVLKQLDTKMKEEYNKYGNSREYQDIVDAYNFLQSLFKKE